MDVRLRSAGILKVPANLKLTNVQRQRIIEARRERVAWMMAQGYSEMRMAEELGVSPSLVHYDIVEIRQQWQAKTLDNVAEAAITDLARLDFIINGLLPQAEFNPKAADSCAAGVTEDSLFQFTQEREGERLLKVFIWNNTPPAMRIHPTPEFVWP
jgi:DNA-binding CsgD family transcriptional regulator